MKVILVSGGKISFFYDKSLLTTGKERTIFVFSKYVVHKKKRGIGGRRKSERNGVPFFPVIHVFIFSKTVDYESCTTER